MVKKIKDVKAIVPSDDGKGFRFVADDAAQCQGEDAARVLLLEPNCCDDAALSLAISAKRQADALERIAGILEKQTGIAELLSEELRG